MDSALADQVRDGRDRMENDGFLSIGWPEPPVGSTAAWFRSMASELSGLMPIAMIGYWDSSQRTDEEAI